MDHPPYIIALSIATCCLRAWYVSRAVRAFGLLFQASDDLLDVIGTQADMGKTLGKDAESGKLTCVSAYGLEGTRARVAQLHSEALDAISRFGDRAAFFRELVDAMVDRTR
jgi:geranylgeranyl pyrophosphate synthase